MSRRGASKFNAGQRKVTPDEVLKKVGAFLGSGKKQAAFEELGSWLVSKRRFQWEDSFEKVAQLYVDTGVSLLKSCKEGMVSYRNMTQQSKPAALERLLRRCIDGASARGNKAATALESELRSKKRAILQQFTTENKEELRGKLKECESEWQQKQFEDETLAFEWSCHLDVLFIIRNNGKLNHVYTDTGMRAARFCLRLKRTNELRLLCETVRKRFYHLQMNQEYEYALKLTQSSTINQLFGMRLNLLQAALCLAMHSESYKGMKDTISLVNLLKTDNAYSAVRIDPFMLSVFYKQCSYVFWFCQRYLLHALAVYSSHKYYREHLKNAAPTPSGGSALPPTSSQPTDDASADESLDAMTAVSPIEIRAGGYSYALPMPLPPYPRVADDADDDDWALANAALDKACESEDRSYVPYANEFFRTDLTKSEKQAILRKKLGQAMLAALIVPPINRTNAQELMLGGDSALEHIAEEFGFAENPTRDQLLSLLLAEKNLPQYAKDLYHLVELDKSPLNFTKRFRALLLKMTPLSSMTDATKSESAESESRESVLRTDDGVSYMVRIVYKDFVTQLSVLRLLSRLSRVYTSISWPRFSSYIEDLQLSGCDSYAALRDDYLKQALNGLIGSYHGGPQSEALERTVVACIRGGALSVSARVDDAVGLIVFGEETGWSIGASQIGKHSLTAGLSDELVQVSTKLDATVEKLYFATKGLAALRSQRAHVFSTIAHNAAVDHKLVVAQWHDSEKKKAQLQQWKVGKVHSQKKAEFLEKRQRDAKLKEAQQKRGEELKRQALEAKLKERRTEHARKVVQSVAKSTLAARSGTHTTTAWKKPAASVWKGKTGSALKESAAVRRVQETVQSKRQRLNSLLAKAKRGEHLAEKDLAELNDLQWELENSLRRERKERMKQQRIQYDYFVRAQRKHLAAELQLAVAAANKKTVRALRHVFFAQKEKEKKQWEADLAKKKRLTSVMAAMPQWTEMVASVMAERRREQLRRDKERHEEALQKEAANQTLAEDKRRKQELRKEAMECERIARAEARRRGVKFDDSMLPTAAAKEEGDEAKEKGDDKEETDREARGRQKAAAAGRVVYQSREAMFAKLAKESDRKSKGKKKKKQKRSSPPPPRPSASSRPPKTSGAYRPKREAVAYDPKSPVRPTAASRFGGLRPATDALRPGPGSRPPRAEAAAPSKVETEKAPKKSKFARRFHR